MSNTEPATVRPPSALTRLGRLACVAVVLLAAAYAARFYVHLARGPAPAAVPPPVADDPAAAALAAVPAGPWALGDQPWDLRSSQLTKEQVVAWLDRPAAAEIDRPTNSVEEAMIALLRARAKPRAENGLLVYAKDGPTLRVRGITRKSGHRERLIEARAVFPEDGHWRALELRPAAPRVQSDAGAGLLPWPEATARLAVRRDEAGARVAELVRVGKPLADLLRDWRKAGWDVSGGDTMTCRGPGGETLHLWSPKSSAGETVLLAIRSTGPIAKGTP